MVHLIKQQLPLHQHDGAVLKVDLKNAFNSISREMLQMIVDQSLPEISALIRASYGESSHLFFGNHILSSQEGVKQGDPLGPLLFSIVLHPLLLKLSKIEGLFQCWYLDDGVLIRSKGSLLQALNEIENFSACGIHLNISKCEIFPLSPDFVVFPEFVVLKSLNVLGVPLDSEIAFLEHRLAKLEEIFMLLPKFKAQSAFHILRSCLSASSKLSFLLRVVEPNKITQTLEKADLLFSAAIDSLVGTGSLSESARIQASLPISQGGLGFRKPSDLSLPASFGSKIDIFHVLEHDNILQTRLEFQAEVLGIYLELFLLNLEPSM